MTRKRKGREKNALELAIEDEIADFIDDYAGEFIQEEFAGCCGFGILLDFPDPPPGVWKRTILYETKKGEAKSVFKELPRAKVVAALRQSVTDALANPENTFCTNNTLVTLRDSQREFAEKPLLQHGFKKILSGVYNPNSSNVIHLYARLHDEKRCPGSPKFDTNMYEVENGRVRSRSRLSPFGKKV